MNKMNARTLSDYIAFYHNGNQAEFARHMGVNRQQVTKWIKGGWIVINHQLFSPQRGIPENISHGGSAL
ncbi:helix-turn-helix domain-containing protein [Escherichia coli]|nr:helix-turn-helix domain-containing protein [Escherichia coli]